MNDQLSFLTVPSVEAQDGTLESEWALEMEETGLSEGVSFELRPEGGGARHPESQESRVPGTGSSKCKGPLICSSPVTSRKIFFLTTAN